MSPSEAEVFMMDFGILTAIFSQPTATDIVSKRIPPEVVTYLLGTNSCLCLRHGH